MAKLLRARFWGLFVVPNLVFATLALAVPAPSLIGAFNAALVALAVGVCVAYHAPVFDILFEDEQIEGSDWLALGIFMSWFGSIVLRIGSIAWRAFGRPDAWENNASITYGLYLSVCAGVFHLAARDAIGRKRIPPQRWIRIGVLIAIGVFSFIVLGYALDWLGVLPTARASEIRFQGAVDAFLI